MTTLRLAPLTRDKAQDFIAEHHRHNRPPVGDLFRVGLVNGDGLVGVGMAGRPVARGYDDGATVELLRVCVNETRNGCSMLYGALCRAAESLGYDVAVTYTREDENGASLRASSFIQTGTVTARTWSCASRPRGLPLFGEPADAAIGKTRWERGLTAKGRALVASRALEFAGASITPP